MRKYLCGPAMAWVVACSTALGIGITGCGPNTDPMVDPSDTGEEELEGEELENEKAMDHDDGYGGGYDDDDDDAGEDY